MLNPTNCQWFKITHDIVTHGHLLLLLKCYLGSHLFHLLSHFYGMNKLNMHLHSVFEIFLHFCSISVMNILWLIRQGHLFISCPINIASYNYGLSNEIDWRASIQLGAALVVSIFASPCILCCTVKSYCLCIYTLSPKRDSNLVWLNQYSSFK